MQVSVTGKQVSIGTELRDRVQSELTDVISKYFDHPIEAHVVLSRSGPRLRADISAHAGRGLTIQARAEADKPLLAFESAIERLGKQLRRNKRRLRDHRPSGTDRQIMAAAQYVPAAPHDSADFEDPETGQPVVVAETKSEIETLSVGEAVMRLDLADAPLLVFQNAGHGGLNVVYRRTDGNVGWVDPKDVATRTNKV